MFYKALLQGGILDICIPSSSFCKLLGLVQPCKQLRTDFGADSFCVFEGNLVALGLISVFDKLSYGKGVQKTCCMHIFSTVQEENICFNASVQILQTKHVAERGQGSYTHQTTIRKRVTIMVDRILGNFTVEI